MKINAMSDLSQMPGPEVPDQHDQTEVVRKPRTGADQLDQKILFSQVKKFLGWSAGLGPVFYRVYWSGGPSLYGGTAVGPSGLDYPRKIFIKIHKKTAA